MQIENPEDDLQRKILDHIREEKYADSIEELLEDENVFYIDLDFMRLKDPELFSYTLKQPQNIMQHTEDAIILIIKENFIEANEDLIKHKLRISFTGNLGNQTVTPRGLKANLLNRLIMICGKVNRCSPVMTRLKKSVHYCEKTDLFQQKQYYDKINIRINEEDIDVGTNQIPRFDRDNNPLTFEHGLSKFNDYQIIGVQELTENVPHGLLSRSIEVYLQEDMVDKAKPGDKVQIIGILKPDITQSNIAFGSFPKYFLALKIVSITNDKTDVQFSPKEIELFKNISQTQNLIDLFARSIAPAIQGHDEIKEALTLMLLGGNEIKSDTSNNKIRGDINILLIGDPGTGKSQFLRRMNQLAPLCINSTGRGSTGVGLTAAIVQDKDTGEKRLEAGAMVLSDRGIICIDEFDKMGFEDRVAMHEVMEQQTVTIAKAGIHMTLNARCSVLAAANPIYGEYYSNLTPSQNIAMQETLLSRFDLIFIVLDENNEKIDRSISQRVTQNHRYNQNSQRNFGNQMTHGFVERETVYDDITIVEPYEQYNIYLHKNKQTTYLKQDFIRKYIAYTKKLIKPKMTEQASDFICKKWTFLREQEKRKTKLIKILPISIRSLEGIIRLSTAYAKLRLSNTIELQDAVVAMNIFVKAFYSGYKEIDINFFQGVEKLLNIGRELKKESFQPLDPSKKKNRSQANVVESKKKTKAEQDLQDVSLKNQEKKRLKKAKQKIFVLISEIKEGKVRLLNSGMTVKSLWKYIKNEKELDLRSEKELRQILNELQDASKIVMDQNQIFLF